MASNRIREWRHLREWSLQQLADACGTTRAQIDKLEKGERRLTVDWMIRLAEPLGCRPADLLPLHDATQASGMADTPAPSVFPTLPALAHAQNLLPVRSAARGGADQEMFLCDGPIDRRPCPGFLAGVPDAYAIYVVGESMVPMYRPSQLLFVNPHLPPARGRGIVITKNNDSVLIKEMVRTTNVGLVVKEYQPTVREFTVPFADIRTAHSVVGAEEPNL